MSVSTRHIRAQVSVTQKWSSNHLRCTEATECPEARSPAAPQPRSPGSVRGIPPGGRESSQLVPDLTQEGSAPYLILGLQCLEGTGLSEPNTDRARWGV